METDQFLLLKLSLQTDAPNVAISINMLPVIFLGKSAMNLILSKHYPGRQVSSSLSV
jgi:hypothetical protein